MAPKTRRAWLPEECGVYRIHNVITRTSYIGGSWNMKARHQKHALEIAKGRASNAVMRQEVQWFGPDVFVFELVEFCTPENLQERETAAIAACPRIYNQQKAHAAPTAAARLKASLRNREVWGERRQTKMTRPLDALDVAWNAWRRRPQP